MQKHVFSCTRVLMGWEDEYEKVTVQAKVLDGGEFAATTYAFVKDVSGMAEIPQGNYAAFYPGNAAHERFVNGE